MAALSGAAGMRYMEFAAGAGRPRPALKQGQGRLAKLRKKG